MRAAKVLILSHATVQLLISCGVGIYLGLHFNILAVLPASILGAGAFWLSEPSLFDSGGVLLFSFITVQAGFFVGLMGRDAYQQLLVRLKIGSSGRI